MWCFLVFRRNFVVISKSLTRGPERRIVIWIRTISDILWKFTLSRLLNFILVSNYFNVDVTCTNYPITQLCVTTTTLQFFSHDQISYLCRNQTFLHGVICTSSEVLRVRKKLVVSGEIQDSSFALSYNVYLGRISISVRKILSLWNRGFKRLTMMEAGLITRLNWVRIWTLLFWQKQEYKLGFCRKHGC